MSTTNTCFKSKKAANYAATSLHQPGSAYVTLHFAWYAYIIGYLLACPDGTLRCTTEMSATTMKCGFASLLRFQSRAVPALTGTSLSCWAQSAMIWSSRWVCRSGPLPYKYIWADKTGSSPIFGCGQRSSFCQPLRQLRSKNVVSPTVHCTSTSGLSSV